MGWFFSQKTLFNYWCLVNRMPTSFPGPRAWRIPVYHSKLSAPSFLSVQLYSFPARSMHMEVSTRKILGSPCLLRRCKFNHELSTGAWRVTYLKWLVSGNDVIFIVLARNNSNFLKLLSREPQTHFTLRPISLFFYFIAKSWDSRDFLSGVRVQSLLRVVEISVWGFTDRISLQSTLLWANVQTTQFPTLERAWPRHPLTVRAQRRKTSLP